MTCKIVEFAESIARSGRSRKLEVKLTPTMIVKHVKS